jgi:iron complex transport system substrate-binding protein
VASKNSSMSDWEGNTAFYAQALDRQQQGQEVLDAIDKRAAGLKARLPAEQRVSVVRWNPQGPIAMSGKIFIGQMLHKVGLQTTALADSLKGPHSDVLSLENLSKIDADWLFVASLNAEGASALEAARQQPAFERLEAVQKARVATVDGQVWASGSGPLAAQKLLDDLERVLLKP